MRRRSLPVLMVPQHSAARRGRLVLLGRPGGDDVVTDEAKSIRREDLVPERHALHLHRRVTSPVRGRRADAPSRARRATSLARWATSAQKEAGRATSPRRGKRRNGGLHPHRGIRKTRAPSGWKLTLLRCRRSCRRSLASTELRRSAPRRGQPALPSRSDGDGATSDVVREASGIRREDLAPERHALHLHLWATFAQKKARRATLARKRAYDLPPLPGRPGEGDVEASAHGRLADGRPPPAEARSKRPPAKALT